MAPAEQPAGTAAAPEVAASSADAAVSERQTTPFLVLQFFIFPMAIVAVCVAVFLVFGLIAGESKGPREHLAEVRSGGGLFNIKRWQAAFALANALESNREAVRSDPKLVDEVVQLFEESRNDDPRVRRYLALALGRLADPRAVAALRKTLEQDAAGDPETLIYATWALGAIGDPSALPELLALAASDDPGLRKAAAHALGSFDDGAAAAALVRMLADPVEDVRWNAALALARRGDPRSSEVLAQMMDRAHMAAVEGLTAEQREQAMLQAVEAAASVSGPALRAPLERLRAGDPNLKVREAARAALEHPRAP
jgi:HEAT repeat protein